MIQNIIDYIDSARKAGKSDLTIDRDLALLGGWNPADILKAKRTLRLRKFGLWVRPNFKRALIHCAYVVLIIPPLFSIPLFTQLVLGPNIFSDIFSWVWTISNEGSFMGPAIAVALSLPYWAMLLRGYTRFVKKVIGVSAHQSQIQALIVYPNSALLLCYASIAFLLWLLDYIAPFF
jgi:hypothetical protein